MEKDGSGEGGAGASVIDLIQSVWDCRAHQKTHHQRIRCVGEPCSIVAGLGFQEKNTDICLHCGYSISKRVSYCTELSVLHQDYS